MSDPSLTPDPVEKLPDISQVPEPEHYKLLVDFYKMRIQEYGNRYESMRNFGMEDPISGICRLYRDCSYI